MPDLDSLENLLKVGGYKLTQNRRLLLQGLLAMDDWVSAQQLYQYVAARNSRVNFSTVYRNLDMLTELGALCRVEINSTTQFYALNPHGTHHHHLICKSCRGIWKLDYCPLSQLRPDDLLSFSNLECRFDVYGFCQACQAKQAETKAISD